jgi:hypothetical protein
MSQYAYKKNYKTPSNTITLWQDFFLTGGKHYVVTCIKNTNKKNVDGDSGKNTPFQPKDELLFPFHPKQVLYRVL